MKSKDFFKRGVILVIFTGMLLLPNIVFSQHEVYLQTPNTIPCFCQEDGIWCGAAVGQMILQGYPGGIEHPFTQTFIWNRIQVHKNDLGVNWATDPDGLRDTLMELGGDPGVNWSIFAKTDAQSLMYSVAYWMTKREFPVAILVFGWAHWITIVGIETDVNPLVNSSVDLQYIEIHDPWNMPCPTANSGGVKSLMTGANWYSNYLYSPGNYPASKWDGNYLAVIEPPIEQGTAKAPESIVRGEVISIDHVKEKALMWIKKLNLKERHPYKIIEKTTLLDPILINKKFKGYYIVPFGYQDGRLSQAAVLINAYNGDFQEVGVFQKPVKYLSRTEAEKIALRHLCFCRAKCKARLIFKPSTQTETRFLPVWEITARKYYWLFFRRTAKVYVTQEGKVFWELTKLPPGD